MSVPVAVTELFRRLREGARCGRGRVFAAWIGAILLACIGAARAQSASPDVVREGEYLARAGDCVACHTTRGGQPFAVIAFTIRGGRVTELDILADPERLPDIAAVE